MADVDVTDASMADLVQRLSQQTATLVRQEMHLAQAELKQKGKRAGMGTGLLGGAGVIGLAALGALVAALILVLGKAVDMWISAFIVKTSLSAAQKGQTTVRVLLVSSASSTARSGSTVTRSGASRSQRGPAKTSRRASPGTSDWIDCVGWVWSPTARLTVKTELAVRPSLRTSTV